VELRELWLPPEPGPDEALERLNNGNKCYAADYHEIGDQRRNLATTRWNVLPDGVRPRDAIAPEDRAASGHRPWPPS
jgi:hypothetical protein